jgi:hypothetical protein
VLGCLAAIFVPTSADAAIQIIGSPLSVPATLNTAEHLNYYGVFTPVPVSPDAPTGLFHTQHYGADTALWNVRSAMGVASVPTTGQALKVSMEGCARPGSGGPAPMTQIHLQDLSPLPDGGARVNLSSQGFNNPCAGRVTRADRRS